MSYSTIISAQQLNTIINDDDVRIFDCRFSLKDIQGGLKSYQSGHLPMAQFADMDTQLSSAMTETSGRHPLPDANVFLAQLKAWGINQDTQVIAYDDISGAFAARLWWMMRWMGHEKVAVLDGGMKQWDQQGLALNQDKVEFSAGNFTGSANMDWLVDVDTVREQLEANKITLIDARAADRFTGKDKNIDPVPGHIPGSNNLPFGENLTKEGVFEAADIIHQRFTNIIQDKPLINVVNMCGSGVTACHNLLAQAVAGMPPTKIFIGSWSQWIKDPSRSVDCAD
jgi:thiosulfate/3-mercaptopyruvate sulfurtransferase|tara:strand:- start:888 stop:1736 length:849 start_codon:yes stop_codon:yes gene_type:complete